MATTTASLEEELQTKNQQVKQYKRQVDAVKTDLDKCQTELRRLQASSDEGQRLGEDLRKAMDENRVLRQKLRQTESGGEGFEEMKQKLKEAEAKVNEYRLALDTKEKSYKRMLEISRKSTGGKSLDWMVEVLDHGPSQDGTQDEGEVILWSAVDEYCRKRKTLEQGSNEGESVKAELSAEIKQLRDINQKQSFQLTREQERNEELTKAASLQSQLNSRYEEDNRARLAVLEEENKRLIREAESLHKELATLRSQSTTSSQLSSTETKECKRLNAEVQFLQDELKQQRARCTELELNKELVTLRSQSVTSSQLSSTEAKECKRLNAEVQFLQNELKQQRARCTELEVNLKSMGSSSSSSSGQMCRLCEVLRVQLADKEGVLATAERTLLAKESALAERDAKVSLLKTQMQKFELVAQNTAAVVSESKKMAVSKTDLESQLGRLQIENRGLEEKCSGLTMQLETARKTISQLDEVTRRQAATGGEMEELRRSVAELKGRNGDLTITNNDLNRKNVDLRNRNGDLERQLEQRRDNRGNQELQDKLAIYENQVQVYQHDFKQEREDREKLHTKFIELEEGFKVKVSDLGQKEKENDSLKWRCAEFDQRRIQMEQQHSDMQHNYARLQEELQVKNQQVKQYKTQVDQCKEKLANYEAILRGVGGGGGYGYR